MRIISIANHKGGTAKTTTARTLGDYMAMQGYKTLLIDLDPQAALTMACGFREAVYPNMVDVIGGAQPGYIPIKEIIRKVKPNLYLAPANLNLSGCELGITSRIGREYIVKRALEGLDYDLAIIDNPPSVSLLTINGLAASEGILIPTQLTPLDVNGVMQFIKLVEGIRAGLGMELEIIGILPTFYDGRLLLHQQAEKALKKAKLPLLDVAIGRTIRIASAAMSGQSILTSEPTNPQAGNYYELGKVIEKWLKIKI